MTDRRDILNTAAELIHGDRDAIYGPPEGSFGRIGALWSAAGFRFEGRELTPVDVAIALTLMKVSRIVGQTDHKDSWVDGAGYLALGGELALNRPEPDPEPEPSIKDWLTKYQEWRVGLTA